MEEIKRLGKIVNKLESLENDFQDMDIDEYKRMRTYIYSRFKIDLPLNN